MNVTENLKKRMRTYGVNEQSMNWILTALNPFSDLRVALEGLPDQRTTLSLVQCLTSSLTVRANGTDSWDALVYTTPFLTSNGESDTGAFNEYMRPAQFIEGDYVDTGGVYPDQSHKLNYYSDPVASGYTRFATLTCNVAKAGELLLPPYDPSTAFTTWSPVDFSSHAIHSLIGSNNQCRMISYGFEIHDVSAVVNKQGTLTIGDVNTYARRSLVATNDLYAPANDKIKKTGANDITPNGDANKMIHLGMLPPPLSFIMNRQDTRQWEVAKGALVVGKMLSINNQSTTFDQDTVVPCLSEMPIYHPTTATPNGYSGLYYTRHDVVYGCKPSYTDLNRHDFNLPCVYLSGLHPDGAFTITCKAYVEYFPGMASALTPIATPSAPFDPKALEFYSVISNSMPVGTIVADNASGDWLRTIYSLAKMALPYALDYFVPGLGQGARLAITAGESVVEGLRGNESRMRGKTWGPPDLKSNKTIKEVQWARKIMSKGKIASLANRRRASAILGISIPNK